MKRGTFQFDAAGLTPLTFGQMFQSARKSDEGPEAYDERCWKERCHALPDGRVFVPPIAFKLLAEYAATLRGDKVPGKGKSTYTKRIKSGIMLDPTAPPTVVYRIIGGKEEAVTLDNIIGRRIMVPSDGKRGGSTRVGRRFPEVDPPWVVHVSLFVVDLDIIEHPEMLTLCFETGGLQGGIGCNRPSTNGGDHGVFRVENAHFEVLS